MAAASILKGLYSIIFVILGISIIISIVCIILSCVWLFPVMNNSKKKEPPIEIRESLILSNSNLENAECVDNLYSFIDKGAYETFNINMKEIHKYSTGLISILFIIIGGNLIAFITFLICACQNPNSVSDLVKSICFCGGLLYILGSILNLIFFIILSVYYYKGKYKGLEDFSKCNIFDYNDFMDIYGFIFKIQKNYKKIFITDIVFICLNFCLFLFTIILIICSS